MNDKHDMLDDLEFENQINALGDDQPALIKFVARQQFDTRKVMVRHGKDIRTLQKRSRRTMGFVGVTGAVIATAVTATIDYFIHRGS